MKKQVQPLTPAALYARVSSDRQDVDEAESGRIADRPQFRRMIDEGGRATAPFQVILNQSQGGIYICGVIEDRLRHPGEALPPAHPRRTATVTGPPPYVHPTLALV